METGSPKIYTRTGDKGKTSLIGGTRVSKAHLRLEAYGTVDELNSWLGLLECEIATDTKGSDELHSQSLDLRSILLSIQHQLFNVGSQLACEDADFRKQLPAIHEKSIAELEKHMDSFSSNLRPLKNFILPGGSRSASTAHVARTVCRRAERHCVALTDLSGEGEIASDVIRYLNRLSDFLFVLSRHLNHLLGHAEPIWTPNQ
jgi:cob(I)alamin adenosyltransferase